MELDAISCDTDVYFLFNYCYGWSYFYLESWKHPSKITSLQEIYRGSRLNTNIRGITNPPQQEDIFVCFKKKQKQLPTESNKPNTKFCPCYSPLSASIVPVCACVFGSLTPTGLSGSTVHWAWALVVNHHTKPLRPPLPAQTPTSSTSSSQSKDRQTQRSDRQVETPLCHPHGQRGSESADEQLVVFAACMVWLFVLFTACQPFW